MAGQHPCAAQVAEARGSLRHDLVLKEASREPANPNPNPNPSPNPSPNPYPNPCPNQVQRCEALSAQALQVERGQRVVPSRRGGTR